MKTKPSECRVVETLQIITLYPRGNMVDWTMREMVKIGGKVTGRRGHQVVTLSLEKREKAAAVLLRCMKLPYVPEVVR